MMCSFQKPKRKILSDEYSGHQPRNLAGSAFVKQPSREAYFYRISQLKRRTFGWQEQVLTDNSVHGTFCGVGLCQRNLQKKSNRSKLFSLKTQSTNLFGKQQKILLRIKHNRPTVASIIIEIGIMIGLNLNETCIDIQPNEENSYSESEGR